MKKIFIPIILVLLLTACSQEEVGPGELGKEEKIEKILEGKLEKCEDMDFEIQEEECLYDYVSSKIYWEEVTSLEDYELCDAFEENSLNRTQCTWLFAMKTRESDLCKDIEYEPIESYNEHLTEEICEKSLSYEYEDASWKLKSGFPPYADPDNLMYEGSAEIRGWVVMEPVYVGDPIEQLKVHDEDIMKLPVTFQKRGVFQLRELDTQGKYAPAEEEFMSELRNYSEQNPATIKITSVYASMEGTPLVGIEEVVK